MCKRVAYLNAKFEKTTNDCSNGVWIIIRAVFHRLKFIFKGPRMNDSYYSNAILLECGKTSDCISSCFHQISFILTSNTFLQPNNKLELVIWIRTISSVFCKKKCEVMNPETDYLDKSVLDYYVDLYGTRHEGRFKCYKIKTGVYLIRCLYNYKNRHPFHSQIVVSAPVAYEFGLDCSFATASVEDYLFVFTRSTLLNSSSVNNIVNLLLEVFQLITSDYEGDEFWALMPADLRPSEIEKLLLLKSEMPFLKRSFSRIEGLIERHILSLEQLRK